MAMTKKFQSFKGFKTALTFTKVSEVSTSVYWLGQLGFSHLTVHSLVDVVGQYKKLCYRKEDSASVVLS